LYVDMLLDSGATHSFVSAMYLQDNHICYEPLVVPNATLADGGVSKCQRGGNIAEYRT
jgi:hypothetical protein